MKHATEAAIKALRSRGHTVVPHGGDGGCWYEIDGRMLASTEQMEELGSRVGSLIDMEVTLTERRAKEQEN